MRQEDTCPKCEGYMFKGKYGRKCSHCEYQYMITIAPDVEVIKCWVNGDEYARGRAIYTCDGYLYSHGSGIGYKGDDGKYIAIIYSRNDTDINYNHILLALRYADKFEDRRVHDNFLKEGD